MPAMETRTHGATANTMSHTSAYMWAMHLLALIPWPFGALMEIPHFSMPQAVRVAQCLILCKVAPLRRQEHTVGISILVNKIILACHDHTRCQIKQQSLQRHFDRPAHCTPQSHDGEDSQSIHGKPEILRGDLANSDLVQVTKTLEEQCHRICVDILEDYDAGSPSSDHEDPYLMDAKSLV